MFNIPLFPLNTVLFPGMPIKLHIFEDRYKLMMSECIAQKSPFGVVLIESGVEALGPAARPHMIGCTAQITYVQKLPQDRMNILAIGRERFRIHDIRREKPYLTGQVEAIPLQEQGPNLLSHTRRLRGLLLRYIEVLRQSEHIEIEFEERSMPEDASTLAYLAAVLLQSENLLRPLNLLRQELLATDSMEELLAQLIDIYQHEIMIVQAMVESAQMDHNTGPFTMN